MLTLTTRIQIALAVLAITVIAAVVLEVTGTGGELRTLLLGWAGATMVQLLDMLQARKRASEHPPEPHAPVPREDTHPRLPLALPREATGPQRLGLPLGRSDWPRDELTEDDIDTERPPAVLPRADDEDPDTDPQTPSAIRRHRS